MINTILEGYPKTKKEFLVSFFHSATTRPLGTSELLAAFLSQDEVGVETDEDCKVVLPSA